MSVSSPEPTLGLVAIGRNEGERLQRCLASVAQDRVVAVYVDSGSTDGSAEMARNRGVAVVDLDMRVPFTAARARNEGFRRLRELLPDVRYVQFVDGDCEVVPGWLDAAAAFLDAHPDAAAVCGRRRERYPERSIYNALCDIEWDTPVGEAKACGGDAMFRADAFAKIGGYRDSLIAGEEPELCVRLRAAGWKIWRIAAEMTLHDAAMTRFGQWWKRSVRGGHAFAEGAFLHGAPPERHWVRECRSARFWALAVPALILLLATVDGRLAALAALLYPVQVVRLALKSPASVAHRWWYALFLVIGKFSETVGHVKFAMRRLAGGPVRLIEYK
ncbi:MAG TPA: glycosyltransferase family A protein [Rhodocyclaceae bacterium]